MTRSCHLTFLKIKCSNLLKFGVEANLRVVSAHDPALIRTYKFLRVLSGLPSTDF